VGARGQRSRPGSSRPSGQHLLRSNALIREIVTQAGVRADELVLEIGAGTGRISEELARAARRVVAVELDPRFADALRRRFRASPAVEVVESDVLQLPLPNVPFRVFGNVPFALTTAILRRLLDEPASALFRADLILQFETARKRASVWPGNLTSLGWLPWWQFSLVRRVPASAFEPVPSVDAGVLAVTRRSPPLLRPEQRVHYVRLLHAGFRHANTPVNRALRGRMPERLWKQVARDRGVVPWAKTSDLDVFDWVALFRLVQASDHV
jgi:23S rRNA (adenine-N6)-dimethyltransferase